MLLNLTDMLSSEEKTEQKQIPYEADVFESGLESYSILKKTPLALTIQTIGKGKVLLKGKISLTLSMNCGRCLKEVPYELALGFEEHVSKEEIEAKESDGEDKNFLQGFQLDTEKLIHNEVLMNLPMKVLCRKDCKGICKQCGKDLNLGECGCDDFVPDPRMAMIKDIFHANKEV